VDLILSDLHANLHAFRAVLRFACRRAIRRFVILGDLVGYGAHPNQLLDKLQTLGPRYSIRGNHDRICAGMEEPGPGYNLPARLSAQWTRERLRQDHRYFLINLPEGPRWVDGDYQIAHGSPADEDAYLLRTQDAAPAFDAFEGQLCFFGHTHLPGFFELDERAHQLNWRTVEAGSWYGLNPHCRYLVNPGSVGQPRDKDRRLAFMTFDPERRRLRLHRLEYDWEGAAHAILEAGLHNNSAERLLVGT